MHHMWKSPTPWVVAALVPAEMLIWQPRLCRFSAWFPFGFLCMHSLCCSCSCTTRWTTVV
jgi:hypothetical protein